MRFFNRKKDQARPTERRNPFQIELSGRNYDELDQCDVAIKFWLPETVEKKIDEMCAFQDTSASDLIRQILFIHLYGRYDLFGLVERQIMTYQLKKKPRIFYSIAKEHVCTEPEKSYTPQVEKSVADFKVWIPARIKTDVQALAQRAGKKPSAYIREVIITHLFGHFPPDAITINATPPDGSDEDVFEDKNI